MARRISTGFELANLNPGTSSGYADVSREAARTGQWGLAYRKNSSRFTTFHLDGAYGNDGTLRRGFSIAWGVWIRIRTLGSGENQWGAVQGLGESPSVGVFTIPAAGTIAVYSVGAAAWAGRTLLWTSAVLTLGSWYRFTMGYLHADPGACPPGSGIPPACGGNLTFALYDSTGTIVGGPPYSQAMGALVNGLGASNGRTCGDPAPLSINAIILGHENIAGMPAQSGLECDFDDLVVENFTTENLYSSCQNVVGPFSGWNSGTLNRYDFNAFIAQGEAAHYTILPTSVTGGVAGWENPAGTAFSDIRQCNQPPMRESANNELVSTTALSDALLTTPAPDSLGYTGAIRAMNVAADFRAASGVNVNTWRLQATTPGSLTYDLLPSPSVPRAITFPRPASTALFDDGDAITYGIAKSNDGTATRLPALGVEFELNAIVPLAGNSDISMITGEYTGNGTFLSVATGWEPDWVFIAPVTVAVAGIIWHDGMIAGHGWTVQSNMADRFQVYPWGFAVMGTANVVNQSGQTYRYIALRDANRRALLRSGYSAVTAAAGRDVQEGGLFTPTALWAQKEAYGAVTTNGAYLRGPGHTGSDSSPLTGTVDADGIYSVVGTQFTTGTALNNQDPQTAWSGWGTGSVFFTSRIWDVVTYTGDGTASRAITVNLSGFAPGFALIAPHNAVSYLRHPSHTGATAVTLLGTSTSTTAITAFAANQVTVGITLNAVGIVYEVLVITGGNAGFPSVPTPPTGTPYPGVGPGNTGTGFNLTDLGPTGSAGMILFGNGIDSGGGTGCSADPATGSPSGGNGCGAEMSSGTDSGGSNCAT